MENEENNVNDERVVYIDPLDIEGFNMDNLNLVSKVITTKELSYNSIRAAIMGIWGNLRGVAISEVGLNKVLISFKDHNKGLQMLKRGPWSIRGHLLNLRIWSGAIPISNIDHNLMQLWVQMHEVHLSHMSRYIVEKLGASLPKLPSVWITLKYERILDTYCLNCGIIGHNKRKCTNPTAIIKGELVKPKYAPGLGVNHPQPISALEEPEHVVDLEDYMEDAQPRLEVQVPEGGVLTIRQQLVQLISMQEAYR
ncbi:hypothetical protein PIB30_011848 [Stylosanthes scabra]|uniref:CCHC-type domain-containing protein n=1 Tax=Stylosanthes scabra TaxID=79078 RepID=A0ABU6T5Q4_9FABA|nr:hypothetical protein [Stylosanthes scabra]